MSEGPGLLEPFRLGTCGSMRGPVYIKHYYFNIDPYIIFTSTTVSTNSVKIFIS